MMDNRAMAIFRDYIKRHKAAISMIAIAVVLIVTRFVPISFGDFYSDNAINAFRAYGWLDYFGASGQTTPLQWFGNIPGWAELSFHDAPPLAFLIQRIFFAIFGGGTVVARLPAILAGIGSIWLVYYLLNKLAGRGAAMIAALAYAVSSYAAWAGQAAYLEGIEEFFIAGTLLFGAFFLFGGKRKKHIYISAVFLACALLTKYTALFFIPPIVLYACLYRADLKANLKHVIAAVAILLAILSPVVIYNVELYQHRGHLDAALSSMTGMHSEDFSIIDQRTASYDVFGNTAGIAGLLSENMSYPFLALALICLAVLAFRIRKAGLKSLESWILINLLCLLILLGFARAAVRFSSITMPFLAIGIGLGGYRLYGLIRSQKMKMAWTIAISAIFLFELAYSVNTNVLNKPVTTSGWLYSENKIQSLGFNELDRFIRDKAIPVLPVRNVIKTKDDTVFNSDDVKGRSAVIFDDRIDWFAQMWYFQRYLLYYRWPVISTAFLTELNQNRITLKDILDVSGKPLYFVYPIDPMVIDSIRAADKDINTEGPAMAAAFDKRGATSTLIMNANGIPVFKVYEINTP